ncbi:hypothetical protein Nepgr_003477 [Nepenthes gracilis]|uniref:Uncharacterized protein n=1 Tax=Nepenthes gracilis TaxID=150966 RepID=A0AAD3RZP1_NEPGR|nr:hypothetical protein Nepgr_003477 [Nepenthes gracilis]
MAWSVKPPFLCAVPVNTTSSLTYFLSSFSIHPFSSHSSSPDVGRYARFKQQYSPNSQSKSRTEDSPSLLPLYYTITHSFTGRKCRAAAEYKFPDPIPEFADAETEKFRSHLLKKLSKKDIYGDSLEDVVGVCTEIFNTFLHTEYGGPGTLLVIPFMDMADTLNERRLPGGPQAARAAVKWAQNHVDKDWKEWTNGNNNR